MKGKEFERKLEIVFIIALIILGLSYMFLASGTQMLGEDEAIYFTLAKDFAQGRYSTLLPDGRQMTLPVFMSLFYSFFFTIFGSSLGLAKAITALFGLLTLFIIYITGKRFSIYYGIFSVILLLSIQMFTQFMMMTYEEVPIAFFSVLLLYLFLSLDSIKKAIVIGITLGIAFYTKSSALVLVGVMIIYALYLLIYEKNKKYFKLTFISLITFAIMLAPFVVRNLLLYNYPYVEGLNAIFGNPPEGWPDWLMNAFKTVSPVTLSLQSFTSTFSWLTFILGIFGVDKEEQHLLLILSLFSLIFLFVFIIIYLTSIIPLETRYLSIIFPQFTLLGGFFLWKAKDWNKICLVPISLILLFSIWSSISTATATYGMQRYPSDYIEALRWVKDNTADNAIIFTTYTGSLEYYGKRVGLWAINVKEFPQIMTTQNGSYISESLKHYNISYILIWRSTIAQNYIIPESNLWGVFTYNFANVVSNDTTHFSLTYSNQDNWIFKLK